MARAVASADGWIATPEVPVDYRGPAGPPVRIFGAAGRDRPVLESLRAAVARHPGRVAVEDAERRLSFARFAEAVARLGGLLAEGTGPVGLLLPNGAAYPVAVFACLAAGRPAVLLDAGHPPERTAALLRLTGTRQVVAQAGVDPAGVAVLPVGRAFEAGPAGSLGDGPLGQDAPAFILCTSGSTGQPKAIVHSQRTVLHQVAALIDGLHLGEADRFLAVTSGAAIAGLFSLFVPLAGCTFQALALGPAGHRQLREALASRLVTVLRAAPSLLRSIARLPEAPAMLAGLRAIRTSGEPLLPGDVALLAGCLPKGCLILGGYGATEAPGNTWFARPEDAQDPHRVAAGVLDPETEAMIQDERGAPCPPGEPGELMIRSRFTALGEWQDGGLVPGRLQPDPADPARRIYRTGDLARLAADGSFLVLGRLDRMVKVNGQRVELAEVETVLRQSPEVAEAAVLARTDAGRVLLLAYVVPVPDAEEGLAERLRARLRQALPGPMQPARLMLLAALPRLPGGKLDEAALPAG